MRLYIAGPMTGYPNFNFGAFNRVAVQLSADGHEVYNPASSFWGRQDLPYDMYIREAVRLVSMSEGIVVLPGWDRSKGALMEMHVALVLGIPTFFWDEELIEKEYDLRDVALNMLLLIKGLLQPGPEGHVDGEITYYFALHEVDEDDADGANNDLSNTYGIRLPNANDTPQDEETWYPLIRYAGHEPLPRTNSVG